jgi:hypothetical protein
MAIKRSNSKVEQAHSGPSSPAPLRHRAGSLIPSTFNPIEGNLGGPLSASKSRDLNDRLGSVA